jgi:hypothetical protein
MAMLFPVADVHLPPRMPLRSRHCNRAKLPTLEGRGRARDAVEFGDEAKILDCHSKQSIEQDGYLLRGVVNAANELRKAIAHNLSSDKVAEKMKLLKVGTLPA